MINNTSTKNINVRPLKSKIKQQVVLKGKTIVNGDIVFASGSGEVLLGGQAKITGEVKGGKIYQN